MQARSLQEEGSFSPTTLNRFTALVVDSSFWGGAPEGLTLLVIFASLPPPDGFEGRKDGRGGGSVEEYAREEEGRTTSVDVVLRYAKKRRKLYLALNRRTLQNSYIGWVPPEPVYPYFYYQCGVQQGGEGIALRCSRR